MCLGKGDFLVGLKAVFLLILLWSSSSFAGEWPQAAGSSGTWCVESEEEVPVSFNVATGENVLWTKRLEESGQGGIAVWGDRIFLSIKKPFGVDGQTSKTGTGIVALCLDSGDGKLIWSYDIGGTNPSKYMYGFSDSTSPSPITDGEYVWFTNASGTLVCLDWEGNLVWERVWRSCNDILKPKKKFTFNKQFEPFMVDDLFIHMEPYSRDDGLRVKGWNYLWGLDKKTGEERWISEDALTHYNTPGFSRDALGRATALIGRGGHHGVPEAPKGYSMIDLQTGKRIWKQDFPQQGGSTLYNASFTKDYAIWFSELESMLTLLDAQSGEVIKQIDLREGAVLRSFDEQAGRYSLENNPFTQKQPNMDVFPAWFSNIMVGDYLYFMCFRNEKVPPVSFRGTFLSPVHMFGRAHLETGQVEYLEAPVHLDDEGNRMWRQTLKTTALNARGLDTLADKRSRRDGWYWCFNGNPICVNEVLFFTSMMGVCYALDTSVDVFDERALLAVNPLGVRGEAWSLNTPSFVDGKLYHRTAKELICIAVAGE